MEHQPILRVTRTRAQVKASYDQLSPFYDYFTEFIERKYRNMALKRLNISRGETTLELGFGAGHGLKHMAEAVGEAGRVYGLDISTGMLGVSQHRLEKAGLRHRVELTLGDALSIPYPANKFEVVFMSFTLELFDTPEIPQVLAEIRRVLKAGGRVGIISTSKEGGSSPLLSGYEWLHRMFPRYIDCRPIYVAQSFGEAGFDIHFQERVSIAGLPGEIVIGTKPADLEATDHIGFKFPQLLPKALNLRHRPAILFTPRT